VVIADERTTQATIQYQTVVLRALQEVEDAIAAYAQEQIRLEHLSAAVAAAQ
jgi:outer membrane protein TolC